MRHESNIILREQHLLRITEATFGLYVISRLRTVGEKNEKNKQKTHVSNEMATRCHACLK